MLEFEPAIIGKTYSLYGEKLSSDSFYIDVNYCVDLFLEKYRAPEELLTEIIKLSKKIKLFEVRNENADLILSLTQSILSKYVTDVESHLNELPFLKRFGGALSTTRTQYLLYMLEFEVSNRINKNNFWSAKEKIALLPHCLHDLTKQCLSEVEGLDYKCKACSKLCYINKMSNLFKDAGITPYIWKEASRKELFGRKGNNQKGVIGIACLPELISGIRSVSNRGIPVLGLPLDANRCIRWMGDFYENSFNLKHLELLISKTKVYNISNGLF